MPEIVALLAIGSLAGVLAGLLGIGGGLVIVPALTAWLAADGIASDAAVPVAVATALGSMLLTSAASALAHHRRSMVDWPEVARLGPSVAVGAAVGAWLATSIPGGWLARIFAVCTALIALRMLAGGASATRAVPPRLRGWPLAGPVIGTLSALIGIGGGSFNVPYMAWNGFPVLRAVATAAACGWPIALAGSLVFVARPGAPELPGTIGYWYLPGVLWIGLGAVLTAPLGAALAHRLGSARLARVFGLFLLIVAARMF